MESSRENGSCKTRARSSAVDVRRWLRGLMDFFSHYGGDDDDIEGDSSVVSISTHREEPEPETFGLVGYGYDYKEVCFFFSFRLFVPSFYWYYLGCKSMLGEKSQGLSVSYFFSFFEHCLIVLGLASDG